jgi:hypothetical protein
MSAMRTGQFSLSRREASVLFLIRSGSVLYVLISYSSLCPNLDPVSYPNPSFVCSSLSFPQFLYSPRTTPPRSSAGFIWVHYQVRLPLDRRFSFRTSCIDGRGYGRRVTGDRDIEMEC